MNVNKLLCEDIVGGSMDGSADSRRECSAKTVSNHSKSSGPANGNKGRKRWSAEEDEILLREVAKHGPRMWTEIAALLPGRNAQHARLRYNNHLRFEKSDISAPFTTQEDELILRLASRYETNGGHDWSELARILGRRNNCIKNRYNLLLRHARRNASSGEKTNRKPQSSYASRISIAALTSQ
mmetsp:Transcript_15123/g.32423  ORF Transcript_15123/g.32423 Transcript_15123/m.32423 type:complete len:183 (+) Transcript_15123:45-593(+)|eukprot:CAMPEP_0185848594 /NCGR_PEP_ID=MMETSP1354-20130828/3409_1 /TAXON_ID=708628 /ORGANISM="Erythrolobus madagascarensis, Strain CCMP3276" /LENGTH=182 /DNA_ID=CAMNT_0028549007 /DNA_START=51 /DNA_END=599 /DNA_ORIENTATION=+